jgi:hypothetical protein
LYKPMIVSASALSYASPTLPTVGPNRDEAENPTHHGDLLFS